MLDKLGLTYPQYLVLLVLWEEDGQTVNEIARRLILNTNTITPLLKRMEAQDLLSRQKGTDDTRTVVVRLTEKGKALEAEASCVPEQLVTGLKDTPLSVEELQQLKARLDQLITLLNR